MPNCLPKWLLIIHLKLMYGLTKGSIYTSYFTKQKVFFYILFYSQYLTSDQSLIIGDEHLEG